MCMLLGFHPLPPAPLSRQAGEAPIRPSRQLRHWHACGRAKRVRHFVYRALQLGLRPLPPAPLSRQAGEAPLRPSRQLNLLMTPFDASGFTVVRSGCDTSSTERRNGLSSRKCFLSIGPRSRRWVSGRATACDASSFCLSGLSCFSQADDGDDDDTSDKKSRIDTASYGYDTLALIEQCTKYTR